MSPPQQFHQHFQRKANRKGITPFSAQSENERVNSDLKRILFSHTHAHFPNKNRIKRRRFFLHTKKGNERKKQKNKTEKNIYKNRLNDASKKKKFFLLPILQLVPFLRVSATLSFASFHQWHAQPANAEKITNKKFHRCDSTNSEPVKERETVRELGM